MREGDEATTTKQEAQSARPGDDSPSEQSRKASRPQEACQQVSLPQEGPAVKVGDLVKYKDEMRGMGGLVGLIIATNGEGFDVRWLQRRAWHGGSQTTTELTFFIEVLSECQTK